MFDLKYALTEFITKELEPQLQLNGFKLKRKNLFTRYVEGFEQSVVIILNKIKGQEAGNIQVNIQFRHDELERAIAVLKDEEVLKKWMTTSISIGYLTEECRYIEWPLNESTDIHDTGDQIIKLIDKYAYKFWEEYSSISNIIEGYKRKVIGLTVIGNDYVWNLSAAYWLLGDTENAVKTLENWKQGRPSEVEIEKAINRIKAGSTETGE
jgi:hypothetical protein